MLRGTLVHQACHYLNNDALDWDSVDPRILPYVEAYALLRKETRITVEQSELTVISEKYEVAGTLDLIGKWGKDNILADIKTGDYSQKQPNWECQIAAYDKLEREMSGFKGKRKLFAFVLKADATYKIFEMVESDSWAVFLAYLRIYKWERRFK